LASFLASDLPESSKQLNPTQFHGWSWVLHCKITTDQLQSDSDLAAMESDDQFSKCRLISK
jgi:hypothetical protein